MATIDLGKIKLVWRGTYNNSTAYTVDDVVQYTDATITSSFICTTNSTGNAPSTGGSVHGSWAYLAKGSGDSTLTTAGDLLYRDGSGNQRLAKGTAGQVLKMNTGATAPEWGTDDGGTIKTLNHKIYGTSEVVSSSGNGNNTKFTNLSITVTPQSASSKFLLMANINGECHDSPWDYVFNFVRTVGGSDTDLTQANGVSNQTSQNGYKGMCAVPTSYAASSTNNDSTPEGAQPIFVDVPNTTSAITYSPSYISNGSNFSFNRCVGVNNEGFCSTFVVMEF